MKLLTRFLLIVLAILLASYVVPGVSVDSLYTALIVALLLGTINLTLKPILFILTLPINIITLGLFTLIINALLFWFVASFVDGFNVSGFIAAFIGALVVSLVSSIGSRFLD